MRVTCHNSNVQRRFYSSLLSLSHSLVLVSWVIAVVLPLLLALGSRGFVLEVNSYHEQPVVKSADQVLCILEGERANEPMTLVHTTFPERIQKLFSNESVQAALVKTSGTDINVDGIAESILVEIAIPVLASDIIRQATVVLVLDYTLKTYAKLYMDVLAVFRESTSIGGDTLYVDGDLNLHQRSALEITESIQQPYNDSLIVNMTTANTTQELVVQSLISGYRKRNYTANLNVPYSFWTSDSNVSEDGRMFRISMNVRIDTANVVYTPQWPEVVKHAWIQYYCIFMFVSALIVTLREYLFTHKLLYSVCVVDEPQRKFMKYE